jgi:alkylation response protein AidB-like acyl-CoA dehydrogenase
MDLNLDREQEELVATARQFLAARFPLTEEAGEVAARHDPDKLRRQVAELGWTALGVPASAGGVDNTLIELVLIVEELGRAGVTCSLTASTPLVAGPLARAGERFTARALALSAGDEVATMPLLQTGSVDESSEPALRGIRTGSGWSIDADYTLVPFGQQADWFLLQADLEGNGPALVLLPVDRVDVREQQVIGGEPRAAVTLRAVAVGADDVLDIGVADVAAVVDEALLTATVLQCAQAIGSCEKALQLAVTWANDREQFGRKIGSFQTVSNRCADMRLGIDAARLLTWEAAWALAEGKPDAAMLVSVAKAYLTQISDMVVFNSHQVHGAMGFSTEYPLHVFTRAIKAFRVSLGSADTHLDRVATALGM